MPTVYLRKPPPLQEFTPRENTCLNCEKPYIQTAIDHRKCDKCMGKARRHDEGYKAQQRERNRIWREKQKARKEAACSLRP